MKLYNKSMQFLILLAGSLILSACKKDDRDEVTHSNPIQPVTINSYPLTIGNSWKYYTEIHVDSAGFSFYDAYYNNYWIVISDTSINGIPSTKIAQTDSNYNGTTHLAYTYYANKPDGFYGMAALNSGSMLHLKNYQFFTDISNTMLNSFGINALNSDTVFVPDSSLYFMKFPVIHNEKWRSYEYGLSFKIKRQWIDDAIITTPAGTFACKKLQVLFDFDDDGQNDPNEMILYQYFGTKGLIKETIYHPNLIFSNGGPAVLNQTTQLIEVNF